MTKSQHYESENAITTLSFSAIFDALNAGKHVRRERWDQDSVLFVQDGELMWQCYGGAPTSHQLDWEDMTAKDWRILPQTAVSAAA